MGTRAAFWIGDPRDISHREWLGCKGNDGCPEGVPEVLSAKTEAEFRAAVKKLAATDDCFARPDGGWPYPWNNDIFLTDLTYAWFDGCLQVTCFHHGFIPASSLDRDDFEWGDSEDATLLNVPSGLDYDRNQPDSIIFLRFRSPRF